MIDFESFPIWQKEAILITEMLCAFYEVKPVEPYKDSLEKKIGKLTQIGTASSLKADIKPLEEILELLPKIQSKAISSKQKFTKECALALKSIKDFLSSNSHSGLPSKKGNLEYWFLAMIEEAKTDPELDNEFLEFIYSQGTFRQWYKRRFGNHDMPFSFPHLLKRKIRPKTKSNYKYTIKGDIYRSLNSAFKRRHSFSDPKKVKASTEETVHIYRKILFQRDKADAMELGAYSYLYTLDEL